MRSLLNKQCLLNQFQQEAGHSHNMIMDMITMMSGLNFVWGQKASQQSVSLNYIVIPAKRSASRDPWGAGLWVPAQGRDDSNV